MSAVRGTKRKSTDYANAVPSPIAIEIPEGTPLDSCNVVRGKIRRLIESGEIKGGEFHNTIGVSGDAYRRFMSQTGKDEGLQSDAYIAAWMFFKKRELAGIKPQRKKPKTSVSSPEISSRPDISGVHLEGEERDAVEIYDTCDEIRRKIAAHLRAPGVTRAQFCRDLHAQYHTDKAPSQIQSAQVTRFMSYRGADTGNTSGVFYAAYVYFEKLRIKEGKPKNKHREEMEKIWGDKGGFNIKIPHQRGYLCRFDERPVQDQYGRVTFQ